MNFHLKKHSHGFPALLNDVHVESTSPPKSSHPVALKKNGDFPVFSRLWYQISFIFTPIWGRFPFWLIFFKGVATTTYFSRRLPNFFLGRGMVAARFPVVFPQFPRAVSRGLWPMLLRRRLPCVSERRCRGVPRANRFFVLGGGKQEGTKYRWMEEIRLTSWEVAFKGGNFKPCLFHFYGKMI